MMTNDPELNKFTWRNTVTYFITNILINWGIAYMSFDGMSGVYIFQGEQSLVRLLWPMAVLLPFFITFDVLKKINVLVQKGKISYPLPERIRKNRFRLRFATGHGLVCAAIIMPATLILYALLPEGYKFNAQILAICLGALAGVLAVIFTLLPIYRLLRIPRDF